MVSTYMYYFAYQEEIRSLECQLRDMSHRESRLSQDRQSEPSVRPKGKDRINVSHTDPFNLYRIKTNIANWFKLFWTKP